MTRIKANHTVEIGDYVTSLMTSRTGEQKAVQGIFTKLQEPK